MKSGGNPRIAFEAFVLDIRSGELLRDGALVLMAQKPLSMLCYLAENRDRVVPKRELLAKLWPGVRVSDAALSSTLRDLRVGLGDDGVRQRIIRTSRGRGVRFVAPVTSASVRIRATDAPSGGTNAGMPFVGRTRELGQLAHCAADAARGRARVAVVVGESGSGKSRLIGELLRSKVSRGCAVARGHPDPASAPAYRPFVHALQQRLASAGPAHDRTPGGILGRLLHGRLAELPARRPIEGADGTSERASLFGSVWSLLERLSNEQTTWFVVEDLDRADAASLDLLASIADAASLASSRRVPLLIIATTLPPAPGTRLDATLRALERQPSCVIIRLAPLGDRAVRQLLAEIRTPHLAPAARRAVSRVTGANPYLIRELASTWDDVGADLEPGSDRLELLARKFSALSAGCREALIIGAFMGDRFGPIAVGAVLARLPDETLASLSEAAAAGVLVPEGHAFRFEHELARDYLIRSVPEPHRREIHRDIASVLASMSAGSQEGQVREIAHHLLAAGELADPDLLRSVARQAGDLAFAVCAWHDASAFYEASLSVGTLSAGERTALHLRAGISAGNDGQVSRALGHFRQAATCAREAGDIDTAVLARIYESRTRFRADPTGLTGPVAMRELEMMLASLSSSQASLRGMTLLALSEGAWSERDGRRTEELAVRSLRIARRCNDEPLGFEACMRIAMARFSRLNPNEALEAWLEAADHARHSGDRWLRSFPGSRITMVFQHLGRLTEARERAGEAESLARFAHNSPELSYACAQHAATELSLGNFAGVEACVEAARGSLGRDATPFGGIAATIVSACAASARGNYEAAERALSQLELDARQNEAVGAMLLPIARTYRLLVAATRQRGEVDVDSLESLVRSCDTAPVSGYMLAFTAALVELCVKIGAPERIRSGQARLALAHERGIVLTGPWVLLVPRVLGAHAAAERRVDEARRLLDHAVRVARASSARVELVRALIDRAALAHSARQGDDLERAELDLRAAGRIARELGLPRHLVRAEPPVNPRRSAREIPRRSQARLPPPR